MRTTLTRTGFGLKQETCGTKPFRVEPHDFGFIPGVDLDKMNQLVDELEAFEDSREGRKVILPERSHPTSRP